MDVDAPVSQLAYQNQFSGSLIMLWPMEVSIQQSVVC